MVFLTQEDFDAAIYNEIFTAITRNDTEVPDRAEARSIEEIKSYLSDRFDTSAIFAATGGDRNAMIIGITKDITLYYIHTIGNPNKIPDIRVKLYDDAIAWLKGVQKGLINPSLPVIEAETSNYVKYGSNTQRENHY